MREGAAEKGDVLVALEGVTRRFGTVTAIDRLSFDIRRGETFCLLGSSGCGKSTAMRLIAGFEQPDEGRILLDGADLAGVPPHLRPVNMMFQSYALFPHLSVRENIAFGLKREGLPKGAIEARVGEMLDLVQLRGLEARKPHQLSGGQKQRVALARALAKRPKLLLLDEPLGALDRKLREQTQFEIMALRERTGASFLIVTHDQDEAMTMADRIAVMEQGRIAQIGTPTEIYERPASRAVARFVGEANLFEGRFGEGVDGLRLFHVDGLPLALRVAGGNVGGAEAALALRPERIRIGETEAGFSDNRLSGAVQDIAYLGDRTVFVVELPGGMRIKASRPNGLSGARALARGEAVTLSFAADAGVVLSR